MKDKERAREGGAPDAGAPEGAGGAGGKGAPGGPQSLKGRGVFGASFSGTLVAPQGIPGARPPGAAPAPGAPAPTPVPPPGMGPSAPAPPPGFGSAPPPGFGSAPPPAFGSTPPPAFGSTPPPAFGAPPGFGSRPPGFASRPPVAPAYPPPHYPPGVYPPAGPAPGSAPPLPPDLLPGLPSASPAAAPNAPATASSPPRFGGAASYGAPSSMPPRTSALSQPPAAGTMPPTAVPRVPPREHPLLVPMYWACSEIFTFVSSLASGQVALRSAHEMRATCTRLFQTMAESARTAGIAPEDVRDAQYALVALIDEILAVLPWEGRNEWFARPLQLAYFNENTAGEGFFYRVQQLVQQPHRAHVTQVYFVCLALGFHGRYATVRGEGLGAVYDQVMASLQGVLPPAEPLSPRAVPPDVGRAPFRQDAPIVRLSLAVLAAAVAVFLVLKLVIGSSGTTAKETMIREGSTPAGAAKH